MPEIAIIGRNFHPHGKESAAQLQAALAPYLKAKEIDSSLVLFNEILFDISNGETSVLHIPTGKDLREFKAVLMTNWFSHASVRKDIAHAIALYLNHHGVTLFNSEALHTRSTSKLSQMMLAALNGVAIPRTVLSLNLESLEKYLKDNAFQAPFILKDAQASRGKSNFLLKNLSEIAGHKADHSEKTPLMAQSLVASDGSDYRFFTAGGRARLAIKRTATGGHLNNTSAGGKAELVDLDQFGDDILDEVSAISKLFHREITGIDIIFDKADNKPYFLEANPIPQIATGSNVDAKLEALASAIEEKVKR